VPAPRYGFALDHPGRSAATCCPGELLRPRVFGVLSRAGRERRAEALAGGAR
jgi:hypothetical protein